MQYPANDAMVRMLNLNSLNPLATATRSGSLIVAGLSSPAATKVTVLCSTANRYGDGPFAKQGVSLCGGQNRRRGRQECA